MISLQRFDDARFVVLFPDVTDAGKHYIRGTIFTSTAREALGAFALATTCEAQELERYRYIGPQYLQAKIEEDAHVPS